MRAFHRHLALTLIVFLACLVGSGCGSSGNATNSQSDAASETSVKNTAEKAEPVTSRETSAFTEQTDTICRGAAAEREKTVTDAAKGASGQAALVTDVAVPSIQQMISELGDLDPPRAEAKEFEAIIGAFEKGVTKLEAEPADLVAAIDAFAEADELAEAYGLSDCGI